MHFTADEPSSTLLASQALRSDSVEKRKLSWKSKASFSLRETFTKRNLRRRVPIVAWLPSYDKISFIRDLIAGITVGLTIIPQSIAYAGVAGLPFEVLTVAYFLRTLAN